MRRRPVIAALGTSIAGSVAGCLGSISGYDTVPDDYDPPNGHYQAGYDARNSGYAAGLTGPSREPTNHRIHADIDGTPLTTEAAMFTATWSAGLDGELRWDVPPPAAGRGLYPALHGDSVLSGIAGDDDDVVWALSQADGTEQWRTDLSTAPGVGALTVLEDAAYFPTVEGVGCVDVSAREEAWQADLMTDHPHEEQPLEWSTPAATPEHVFMINHGPPASEYDGPKLLYAVHRDSGELDWAADLGFSAGRGWGVRGPIVGEQYVFVTTLLDKNPDEEPADDRWVWTIAIDPAGGEIAWSRARHGTSTTTSPASVVDGRLYVSHGGAESGEEYLLSAIDTADGSAEWTTAILSPEIRATATDELVYLVDGTHCLAIDSDDGSIAWRITYQELEGVSFPPAGRPPPTPIVQDDRVFIQLGESDLLELW